MAIQIVVKNKNSDSIICNKNVNRRKSRKNSPGRHFMRLTIQTGFSPKSYHVSALVTFTDHFTANIYIYIYI